MNPSLLDDPEFAAGYEEWLDDLADAEFLAAEAEQGIKSLEVLPYD